MAAVGYGGWLTLRGGDGPEQRLAEGERLLAAGELSRAVEVTDAVRADFPTSLEGFLLSADVHRALHHRPETERLLAEAYTLAPAGFARLPLYVDHRLRGPDDPEKGLAALAFLDAHLAAHPADEALVVEGRLVALAYLLGQPTLAEGQRAELRARAEAALAAFHIEGAGTTEQHYDRAQVLLALGKVDDAIAAGRAGIAAGTETWVGLVMHWAIATTLVHRGEANAAWAEMEAIEETLATWPGTHYGMGKPLVELMQLTAAVRFGKDIAPPADHDARLARLEDEGVTLQAGDAETRELVRALLPALKAGDTATALAKVDDLLTLVGRDRGCEMENQMIRPHAKAMLLTTRGDLLARAGDAGGAAAAYAAALALFPADPWLAAKAGAVAEAGAPAP